MSKGDLGLVEELRLIAAWHLPGGQWPVGKQPDRYRVCGAAAAELERLQAEVEALRKDAERYRWLRDPNNMRAREVFRYYGDVDAAELDAAIDAAMAVKGKP